MMIFNGIQMNTNIAPLVITGGVVLLILGLIQLYLGLKAQKSPKVTGERAMIGETGIIRKASGFMDRSIVEVRGELWWCLPAARSTVLSEGNTVKIVGIEEDSMILEVDNE
ncbi:MAG: hypothetical protein GQ565_03325 [Candidatus Aegiribacteria sp.]|nr:hypothetical protein [Candidatus Aegiribacteria sp.]